MIWGNHIRTPLAFAVTMILVAEPRIVLCQIPTHVVTALEENAKAINGIKIEWTTKRTSSLPIKELARTLDWIPQLAYSDYVCQEETAYAAVDDGRVHARFSFVFPNLNSPRYSGSDTAAENRGDSRSPEYLLHVNEFAFDGTHIFSGMPVNGELPTVLTVSHRDQALKDAVRSNIDPERCECWRSNYWRAAGFYIPTNVFDFQNPSVQSSILDAASIRGSLVEFNETELSNQKVARISISAFGRCQVFYLDPEYHYAMVKHEQFDAQSRLISTTVSRKHLLVATSGKLYLPNEIDVSYCQLNGRPTVPANVPITTTRYTLKSFNVGSFTAADFQLDYSNKPGTYIHDDRLTVANYVVPKQKAMRDNAIQPSGGKK